MTRTSFVLGLIPTARQLASDELSLGIRCYLFLRAPAVAGSFVVEVADVGRKILEILVIGIADGVLQVVLEDRGQKVARLDAELDPALQAVHHAFRDVEAVVHSCLVIAITIPKS